MDGKKGSKMEKKNDGRLFEWRGRHKKFSLSRPLLEGKKKEKGKIE